MAHISWNCLRDHAKGEQWNFGSCDLTESQGFANCLHDCLLLKRDRQNKLSEWRKYNFQKQDKFDFSFTLRYRLGCSATHDGTAVLDGSVPRRQRIPDHIRLPGTEFVVGYGGELTMEPAVTQHNLHFEHCTSAISVSGSRTVLLVCDMNTYTSRGLTDIYHNKHARRDDQQLIVVTTAITETANSL